jgi:hypothetical protein
MQGDRTDCPSPAGPLPQLLAAAYAARHTAMLVASAAPPFANGTVLGAAWYPVLGSLQDYALHALGWLQLTLELHEDKRPLAEALPGLWSQNEQVRSPALQAPMQHGFFHLQAGWDGIHLARRGGWGARQLEGG